MSSFTTPLKLEYIDGRDWKVTEEFIYRIGSDTSEEAVKVPAGEITDFASIPRVFWRILPPTGEYGKAAVIHDYLYKHAVGTRKWCDDIFLEAMGVLKVSAWKRYAIYNAVRSFGWAAWNNHRKNDAKQ